ncbi:hypothetical protein GPECTOR_39g508 [Gonium pectorale]|uniref:SAM domain-containing protein n=1 Tax=Gonium pectorale TaxID=33097 RepID=A0A150GB17_GONPE|nr:hypothetical protein GPECTOR_39g508 [Gonium pectorale]|eukprot:KXZ47014.1 hypothetical protein GPECTOR_39g508 [Gonium pectorale]
MGCGVSNLKAASAPASPTAPTGHTVHVRARGAGAGTAASAPPSAFALAPNSGPSGAGGSPDPNGGGGWADTPGRSQRVIDTAARLGSAPPGGASGSAGSGVGAGAGGPAAGELAAGRSQLGRGYLQLPLGLPLPEWDDWVTVAFDGAGCRTPAAFLLRTSSNHVRQWFLTLPPSLQQYGDTLVSPGGLLLEWDEQLLMEAGVANAFHRRQLLEYVRQLRTDVAGRVRHGNGQHHSPAKGAVASAGASGGPRRLRLGPDGDGASGGDDDGGDGGAADCGFLPGSICSPKRGDGAGGAEGGEAQEGGAGAHVERRRSAPPEHPGADAGSGTGSGAASPRAGGTGGGGGAGGGGGSTAPSTAAPPGNRLEDYEQPWTEGAVSQLKALVLFAGSMCPWPGDAAAQLLAGLLDAGERALVNRRNWQQLNTRAADILQIIANNKRLQADTHVYRSVMNRLINTLKGIREYFTDYTNRNWLKRIISNGRDQFMFQQLWDALGALVADASLGLQVEAAGAAEATGRALERLNQRQLKYDDEEAKLRSRIEALGGVEALVRDPSRLLEVAAGLGLGDQLTLHKIQEAVSLLEANRSEGVHSLIPHPDLRVLWRKCFSPRQDVGWPLWWEAFPVELARVPVESRVIAALLDRLADERRRRAFERRLAGGGGGGGGPDGSGGGGRISVVELRRHVPADADLVPARVAAEPPSTDGRAEGVPSGTSAAAAAARAGAGSAGGAGVQADALAGVAAAARPPSPPPVSGPEPRCHLPPLDPARFVGREAEMARLAEMLSREGGAGGGGGGVRDAKAGSWAMPRAVCIVAEAGAGKTSLAVAAARRLWERGQLPGGAYHVDLMGADCRAELAARFARALGVAKPEHDDTGGTAALSLALQSLATRGSLMLVLDGADCLDELYDIAEGEERSDAGEAADAAAASERVAGGTSGGDGEGEGGGDEDGGGGAAGRGGAHEQGVEAALAELLSVVPSAHVLLTATEPLQLRGREVEHLWLGPLPEAAAVALVQDCARCLSADEARQLVSACGSTPLVLRLAASAVGAGALTLSDTMSRARMAAAAASVAAASPATTLSSGGAGRAMSTARAAVARRRARSADRST